MKKLGTAAFETLVWLAWIARVLGGAIQTSATPYFVSFATPLLYLLPPHICIICRPIFVSFATPFWKIEICVHCGGLRGGRHGGRQGGRHGGRNFLKNLNVNFSWRVGRQGDRWGRQGDDGGRAGRLGCILGDQWDQQCGVEAGSELVIIVAIEMVLAWTDANSHSLHLFTLHHYMF